MRYRDDIMGDEGLCIEVRGEVEGEDTELLRFDCFRVAPHYHYGPQAGDERVMPRPHGGGRLAGVDARLLRARPSALDA